MLDIGTGDGLFVYRAALANPHKFFIGLDPNRKPLEKISEKIYRRPARGGARNAMFVQAAVEDLPAELNNVVSEVFVNFPWGGLLRVIATGDGAVLSQIRRICCAGARLQIVLAIDPVRDKGEVARLRLPDLNLDYVDATLAAKFRAAGFELVERRPFDQADWLRMESSWGRRLRGNARRTGMYLSAHAASVMSDSSSLKETR